MATKWNVLAVCAWLGLLGCEQPSNGPASPSARMFVEPGCGVEATVLAVLADASQQPLDHPQDLVAVGDFFFVSPLSMPYGIVRYTPSGGYSGELVSEGRGPGEFLHIQAMAEGPDGELHVVDDYQGRYVVLDTTLGVVRSFPLNDTDPLIYRGLEVLSDGRSLLLTHASGARRLAHVLDSGGSEVASFRPNDEDSALDHWTVAAPSRDAGLLWIGELMSHRIELWDIAEGMLVDSLVSVPQWFTPVREEPKPRGGSESYTRRQPAASLRDLFEDEEGRLWLVSQIPRPGLQVPQDPDGALPPVQDAFHSVIEVVDPHSGLLIAECRIAGFVQGFPRPRVASLYIEGPNGEPNVIMVSLAMKEKA